MDLKSVISKNIDEYLKPKYPIYKLYYIACWDCEGGGMETKRLVKLVEVLPIDKYNEDKLEFEDGFICNFILDCFDDNNVVEKDATDYDKKKFQEWGICELKYIIYKIERLA
tara:strand:+ start:56 stop:391 length:336 start_codon:yes stop_codon:yes gene_type:complete